MHEMRRLIGQGRGLQAKLESPTKESSHDDSASTDTLKEQVLEAERALKNAVQSHESLISELQAASFEFDEVGSLCSPSLINC